MSLILDALNRARRETGPVPGLDSQHELRGRGDRGAGYLLGALLVLCLAVIAWLLLERDAGSPATPAVDSRAPAGSGDETITGRADSAAPAPVTAPPGPDSSLAEAVSPAQGAGPVSGTELKERVVARPAGVEDAAAVARLYEVREPDEAPAPPPRAVADPDTVEARAADIEQLVQMALDESRNVGLADHPVPFLADLSQQAKDEVPTVFYQRHDYAGDAGLSTVVLNGKTLRTGESPAPGMTVEEILPDSVVLNYRGQQFRLRALNSWVNL